VFTYFFDQIGITLQGGDLNGDGLLTAAELNSVARAMAIDYIDALSGGLAYVNPQFYDGSSGSAVIAAFDGDDSLAGGGGNDTLDGGSGFDTLVGGSGDDTYIYGEGYDCDLVVNWTGAETDGYDVVRFTDGYTGGDFDFRRMGDSLVAFTGDALPTYLRVDGWFAGDQYKIDEFLFSDGTVLTAAQATDIAAGKSAVFTGPGDLTGTAGNDYISGSDAGDQILIGDAGNDVYMWFGSDSADDTIVNSITGANMGNDRAYIGAALFECFWSWSESSSDLLLAVGTATLTFQNWLLGTNYQVDTIAFGDGTTVTNTDINNVLSEISSMGYAMGYIDTPIGKVIAGDVADDDLLLAVDPFSDSKVG